MFYKEAIWDRPRLVLFVTVVFLSIPMAYPQVSIDKLPQGMFAQKTPLREALPFFLPEGVELVYADSVDQKAPISIPYTRSWRNALTAALGQLSLEAEIQGKTVFIFPCKVSSSCRRGLLFDTTPVTSSDRKADMLLPKRSPHDEHRRWAAHQGSFVEDVIKGWASLSDEKWAVVYEASNNYALTASASFEGNFLEAAQQLFSALAPHTPLRATFYTGNRTIVVADD